MVLDISLLNTQHYKVRSFGSLVQVESTYGVGGSQIIYHTK